MKQEMLKLMEKNAKISITDLASIFGLSETIINREISECEKQGIIAGYHTIINWDKANTDVCKAMIAVNSVPQRDSGYDHIAELISAFPEVDSLYLVSGKTEFMLIINGKTMKEVADFVAHKLAPMEGINSTQTMFILKEYKISGEYLNKDYQENERLIVTP